MELLFVSQLKNWLQVKAVSKNINSFKKGIGIEIEKKTGIDLNPDYIYTRTNIYY